MAWESRKRGGRYYTRSRKIGGRVVREYVGTGLVAELVAAMDSEDQEARRQAREAFKAEYNAARAQEAALVDYCKAVTETLTQALYAAGYHKHKGQWRRKRAKD